MLNQRAKKTIACGLVAASMTGMLVCAAPTCDAKSFSDYGTHDRLDDVNRELDRLQNEIKKMNESMTLTDAGNAPGIGQLINFQEEIRSLGRDWAKLYQGLEGFEGFEGFEDFEAGDYAAYIDTLIRETENAMFYSARAQGLVSQLPGDVDQLRRLQDASKNAKGTLGAQQAANEMTALMVEQLMRLQQMMSEANNAQATYWQTRMENEAAQKEFDKKYTQLPPKTSTGAKASFPGLD